MCIDGGDFLRNLLNLLELILDSSKFIFIQINILKCIKVIKKTFHEVDS